MLESLNARDLHGMLLGAANTMKLHNYQYKTPEGVTSTGLGDANTDINIRYERFRFDDYVAEYNAANGIDINTESDEEQQEFFEMTYLQNYTRAEAIEDQEVVKVVWVCFSLIHI